MILNTDSIQLVIYIYLPSPAIQSRALLSLLLKKVPHYGFRRELDSVRVRLLLLTGYTLVQVQILIHTP
jgi:hypothetical protein